MQIIGQKRVLETIENWTEVPRFITLQGGRGTGKTTIKDVIVEKLKCLQMEVDPAVDSVRNMLETAYTIQEPIVYFMERAEKMSMAARNCLLKVTEEPPANAYIVLMTTEELMGTLRSRSQLIEMQRYTVDNFKEYAAQNDLEIPQDVDGNALCIACTSFDELKYILQSGDWVKTLALAEKILKYIDKVMFSNAFKPNNEFALKKDAEGLDPKFFLRFLVTKIMVILSTQPEILTDDSHRFEVLCVISDQSLQALTLLKSDTLSKSAIMDMWILRMIQRIEDECS